MLTKWDRAHLRTAAIYAELSSAQRLKVGCVLVRDHRVLSIGYNGMPAGWDNRCEEVVVDGLTSELRTRPEVLHAESNCIAKVARSSESSLNSTAYITHAPCLACAKLLYQAGVSRVVFGQAYRDRSGTEFLRRSNIEVIDAETV